MELCNAMGSDFLKLHPADNVVIAIKGIQAGQQVVLEVAPCTVHTAIPRYFKIADRQIAKGDRVIKCGMVIGVALRSINPGELVHAHNIKSDYMASFTGTDHHGSI